MFVVAPYLVLWYTAHAALSRFAGTCTMGDTDRFVAGMLLGGPAALIAVASILLAQADPRLRRIVLVINALTAPVVLYLYLPLALSTGLRGHHLCGPEFDVYLSAADWWERFIPVLHVAFASALLLAATTRVVRGRNGARRGAREERPGGSAQG